MNHRRVAIILSAGTLILVFLIMTDSAPVLRGPVWLADEWRWPYLLADTRRLWLPMGASVLSLLVSALWFKSRPNNVRSRILILLALTFCNIMLQLGFLSLRTNSVSQELIDRSLSDQTSGYFRIAAENDDLGSLLRSYPNLMPEFASEHARTHPPGLVSMNWLLIQLANRLPRVSNLMAPITRLARCTDLWVLNNSASTLGALAFAAYLPMVIAALSVPLAYGLARRLASESVARLSAVLVMTLPALILFVPLADQVSATFCLAAVLWLMIALQKRSLIMLFLGGMLLSILSFLSLGNLAVVIIIIGLFLANWVIEGISGRERLIQVVSVAVGLISIWVFYWLLWKVSPGEIIQTALTQHYDLVTGLRNYQVWLFHNLIDLAIFIGISIAFGFVAAVFVDLRNWKRIRTRYENWFTYSLLILLILLIFSGSTRGEVGRIWLFFMPLLAISASTYLAGRFQNWPSRTLLAGLQLFSLAAIGIAWLPVEAVIVVAQQPVYEVPKIEKQTADRSFGQQIFLEEFGIDKKVGTIGGELTVALTWSANRLISIPYKVFLHLVSEEGTIATQIDQWPGDGRWPPTCWRSGESLSDFMILEIPEDIKPGEYVLVLGVYDGNSGARLPLANGEDAIALGTITIGPG